MARHLSIITPDDLPKPCPHCERIQKARADLDPLVPVFQESVKKQRDLEEEMHALQREMRAFNATFRKLADQICEADVRHPMCGLCRSTVGPGHASETLQKEPHGTVLVCEDCYGLLKQTRRSAAEQTRIYLQDGQEAREA